jgi:telomere length regulation protein
MDELLTPVSTTYLKPRKDAQPLLSEVSSTKRVVDLPKVSQVNSPDEALEILRNQPDYDSLVRVLRYLTTDAAQPDAFNVHVPGPKSAAIIHVLVTDIAANYWTLLKEGGASAGTEDGRDDLHLFVACLQSVTGLNAVLTHLKALIQEHKLGSKEAKRIDLVLHISIFLDVLATVLEGDSAIQALWTASTQRLATQALRKVQSQALLSLITGGRILSIAAEAIEVAGSENVDAKTTWPADGAKFTQWVAHNVIAWAKLIKTEHDLQFCSDVFQRGLSLGYQGMLNFCKTWLTMTDLSPESLVKTVIDGLLLREGSNPEDFSKVCLSQSSSAKRTMNILLQHLAQHLNGLDLGTPSFNTLISAAAGVIDAVIKGNEGLYNHLVSWCTSSSGAGLGDAVGIRRAVLAVLAQNKDGITTVFEKSLAQFGDQLYIKHAAILQQNGNGPLNFQTHHCCIALTPASPCRSATSQCRLRFQTISH